MKKSYELGLSIVKTLREKNYTAYFAGGWVRDFLLQEESEDIDIATNAPPEMIQKTFSHTIPIGIAFGIVLVILEDRQFEVATFRKDFDYHDGRKPSHVEFSSAEQDAKRRDFTINGLFYDPITQQIFDYVGGQKDLKDRILRAIGDPSERFLEDRLRMIRAIRLACRFQLTIEENTKKAILEQACSLFPSVSIERVWQEFCKMDRFKNFETALLSLQEYGLLPVIFPELKGVPIEEIQERLKCVKNFPENCPLMGKILELFPNISQEKGKNLCQFLKLSQKETKFALLLISARKMLFSSPDLDAWAHFYANPDSKICMEILACHQKDPQKFLEEDKKRVQTLLPFIERISHKNPVVRASDLESFGIVPGKEMGLLLREAEKIAINTLSEDKEDVLKTLQKAKKLPPVKE